MHAVMFEPRCAKIHCQHPASDHVGGRGACNWPSCVCFEFEAAVPAVTPMKPRFDSLFFCYCCGRQGCTVSKCPYFKSAKPIQS